MGTVSVIGAIIIITAWISLIEFDSFPEPERIRLIEKIKRSPIYIILIALLPIGIITHTIGGIFGSVWLMLIGASLIVLQSIIVALLLWKRTRWKGILLLAIVVILGIFIYLPLFIY